MAIKEINLPLYNNSREVEIVKVRTGEFASRMCFRIFEETNKTIEFECYFDDLNRAWDAIKP